mmetsp:Transcript_28236/g.66230  ORF Transcript_28236/g.66230 Transcript_28236/m.66230 type:complete len:283 (+) Transcript_28236:156-1004(+)
MEISNQIIYIYGTHHAPLSYAPHLNGRTHAHVHAIVLRHRLLGRLNILKCNLPHQDGEVLALPALEIGDGTQGLQGHLARVAAHVGGEARELQRRALHRRGGREGRLGIPEEALVVLPVPLRRDVGSVHVLLDDVLLVVIAGRLDAVEELLERWLGPDGLLELAAELGRPLLLSARPPAGALVPDAQFDQHELGVHVGHGRGDGDALLQHFIGHVVVLHGLNLRELLGDGRVVVIQGHLQAGATSSTCCTWPTQTDRNKGRDGAQGEEGGKGSRGNGSHGCF